VPSISSATRHSIYEGRQSKAELSTQQLKAHLFVQQNLESDEKRVRQGLMECVYSKKFHVPAENAHLTRENQITRPRAARPTVSTVKADADLRRA